MKLFRSLTSTKNLELAWHRITTASNPPYKNFFRGLHVGYSLGLTDNLRELSRRLREKTYEPQEPIRIYTPKASGLQRPISLLHIEDQIVLQAFANLYARLLRERRKNVERKVVFSNLLNTNDSIFFVQDWRKGFTLLKKQINKIHGSGYEWVGHFDLSAFYDTVSHDLVGKTLTQRGAHNDLIFLLEKCLSKLTHSSKSCQHSHGIPQGPIASDVLAEFLLLPIDEQLMQKRIKYVRYVDDIRIFGRTENEVRKAALYLEETCRERGLIPNGDKYSIKYAANVREALGRLPSLSAQAGKTIYFMDEDEVNEEFLTCVDPKKFDITDVSRFKYIMFHAASNKKMLPRVLRFLTYHPEMVDPIAVFLEKFGKSRRICNYVQEVLEDGVPYAYVEGRLWEVLANCEYPSQKGCMIDIAVQRLSNDPRSPFILRKGMLLYLCATYTPNAFSLRKIFKQQREALLQGIILPSVPNSLSSKDQKDILESCLKKKAFEAGIAAAYDITRRGIAFQSLGLKVEDLSMPVQNVLQKSEIIKRRKGAKGDSIGELLSKRYNIPYWKKWKKLLGSEYDHALEILIVAETVYDMQRSSWICLQDSFNNVVLRALLDKLKASDGRMTPPTKDANNNLIKMGGLVQDGTRFASKHKNIQRPFFDVHKRRCSVPDAHPYDEKTSAQTKPLERPRQTGFKRALAGAYKAVIKTAESL